MAQYRLSAQMIGRSSGRSATGAAAYRAAEVIVDQRTGLVHDYTRKRGVMHSEVMTPAGAPDWMSNRAELWNAVEKAEKRRDAQLAREILVSLPHELTHEQRTELVRGYVQNQFVEHGMVADIAIHEPNKDGDERNFHAHILLTTRNLFDDGFGKKERGWNDRAMIEQWREQWADHQNRALRNAECKERVSHLSLADQGIVRKPTVHLGPVATQIERSGRQSTIANDNREIERLNGKIIDLEQGEAELDNRADWEKRKFAVWAERKRGQLDIDKQHRAGTYQVGLAVRMQALEDVLAAEFGDTKANLTHEHDQVAAKLASTGWRKFVRDISRISGRDRRELHNLEAELARVKAEEDRKRQMAVQVEANRQNALKAAEILKARQLNQGIQKAKFRREAEGWEGKRPTPPPERVHKTFKRSAGSDVAVNTESGSQGDTGGLNSPPIPDHIKKAKAEMAAIKARDAQRQAERRKQGKGPDQDEGQEY